MERDDPFVRVAMDGREPTDADATATINGSSHQMTTFFYVVFGLVFETLAASTPDVGAQNVRNSIVALKALKHLVKPQYAGDAFKDISIFEELVNMCYRMALTEPVAVQVYLVDTLASLAYSVSKTQT